VVVVTFLNGFITKPSVKSILTTCHALPLCLIIFSRGIHTHIYTHTHAQTHITTEGFVGFHFHYWLLKRLERII